MSPGRFTEHEYRTDTAAVVAHAQAHGRAEVVDESGDVIVAISIPAKTAGCPTCGQSWPSEQW